MRPVLSILISGLFLCCGKILPVDDDKSGNHPVDSGIAKLDCDKFSNFHSAQEYETSDLILQVFDSSNAFLSRKTLLLPDSLKRADPIRFEWDQKTEGGKMLGSGRYTLKYTYVDKSKKNQPVYFGCQEVTIRVGDYASYGHFTNATHGIPDTYYRAVAVASNNDIWFITSDELIRYSGTFESISNPLPGKFFFKLGVRGDDEPVVMFSSNSSDAGGVVAFYDGGWTFYDHENSPIPDRDIYRAYESKKGELWITTADGVMSFRDSEWIPRYQQDPLFAKGASAFAEYDSLGIYMAIKGIDREIGEVAASYQPYYYDGTSLKLVTGKSTRFPEHNQIFSLDFARDGTLWIAMREYLPSNMEGGLVKFQNNEFTHYTASNSKLPGNAIEIALATNNGKVVLATDGYGVGLFDEAGYKTLLDGIDVTDMKIDNDGNLWVTTFANGIYRFPYNHETITVSIPTSAPQ